MAQIVVFVFSVTLTLTFDICSFFVTRIAHDVLEYICEVSLESVQYEWVICCGKSFDKRPMLYNGVFGCQGNTCYVIFIGAIFYMLYSIGPINVCTDFEINRYKIDEVRKYAKIAFYLIYLTSCDAKTLRHASWGLRHF